MSLWRKSAPCGRGQGPRCMDQYGGQVQCPSGQGRGLVGEGSPGGRALGDPSESLRARPQGGRLGLRGAAPPTARAPRH